MDPVTELRRATLIRLKSDAAYTALIPATRTYGQTAPAAPVWPFLKTGVPITTPRLAACLNGAEIRHTLHVFAAARMNGAGSVVETADDHIGRIIAAVKASLDGATLSAPAGSFRLRLISDQRLTDEEPDAFHGVIEFRARFSA